jgi:hypothetical protein
MQGNYNGESNSAFGSGAMGFNFSGDSNTAVGSSALFYNVSGWFNTALGAGALSSNTTGSFNVAVGTSAGSSSQGSWNIAIANIGSQNDSNTIRVGDNVMHTRTFVAGIRAATTVKNDAINVVIDSDGQLGTISSSRKTKVDIADMNDASAALMQLRPVTFHYKADRGPGGPRLQYGLVAEEVAEVYPGMVATKDGKPETVMYQYLAPMLLNEFQKQQRTIEAQAKEIAELKRSVEMLLARPLSDSRMAAR